MLFEFIEKLSEILRINIFKEKWIIALNLRVGFQWIDAVTMKNQMLLNCRIKTVRTIAFNLASSWLAENDIRLISELKQKIILEHIFKKLKKQKDGYFSELKTSTSFINFLLSSIKEIRSAGLSAGDLNPSFFEVKEKGEEITGIIKEYERILENTKYIDYAGVLEKVIKWICEGKKILPENLHIIASSFDLKYSLNPLEKRLWDVLPENVKIMITSDDYSNILNSDEDKSRKPTSLARLYLFNEKVENSVGLNDGTVSVLRASGYADEVSEVFRRIINNKIPFDDVEILYTDSYVYKPLIYELSYMLNENIEEEIPVTFSEGIQAIYSRPGRALSSWISLIEEDFPQKILKQMIQDGLLKIKANHTSPLVFTNSASLIRQLPVGKGKERYKKAIEVQIDDIMKKISELDSNTDRIQLEKLEYKKSSLSMIAGFIQELFEHTPSFSSSAYDIIDGVKWFLDNAVNCVDEIDFYSVKRMMQDINELAEYSDDFDGFNDFNVWDWLKGLARNISVLGKGPRPGKIYVTSLKTGGYSARKYTFILGMDDSRFPEIPAPDPILLDQERDRISKYLIQKNDLPEKEKNKLACLFARLSGKLFLCYSCEDTATEKQLFPSPVVLKAYQILYGNTRNTNEEFDEVLGPPAGYAALIPEDSITLTEWWISQMCGKQRVENPEELISLIYPDLKKGFIADRMRASSRFTVYDGYVPLSGKDLNPYDIDSGTVLSSSSLELLGKCPFDYFLKYVLGIEAPPDKDIDMDIWLEPAEKGNLLHAVFREFMQEITSGRAVPSFSKHRERIQVVLEKYIEYYKKKFPPLGQYAFNRDVIFLYKCADIFLRREEYFHNKYRPEYFEVSVGMKSEGAGSELDRIEPFVIQISVNKKVRAKARLDRIDRIMDPDSRSFAVWDYKTGSSYNYKKSDPFRQGRIVQNVLYMLIADILLKEKVLPSATVKQFGYFFPNLAELGRRIYWNDKELKHGFEYLALLCELIQKGCYPYTDTESDIKWSCYADAVINPEEITAQAKTKLMRSDNILLNIMRKLRDYEDKT